MRGEVSTGPPAAKSPFLLMTNQNQTSSAPPPQSQTLDSGAVHESQRQQLWLSLNRSHRRTCVRFCLECFTCAPPITSSHVPSLQNPYKTRVSLVESDSTPLSGRSVIGRFLQNYTYVWAILERIEWPPPECYPGRRFLFVF